MPGDFQAFDLQAFDLQAFDLQALDFGPSISETFEAAQAQGIAKGSRRPALGPDARIAGILAKSSVFGLF
jgi:hypothetical protein